jgi:hypothetical protein
LLAGEVEALSMVVSASARWSEDFRPAVPFHHATIHYSSRTFWGKTK